MGRTLRRLLPRSPLGRAGIATLALAVIALTVLALFGAEPSNSDTPPQALKLNEVLGGTPSAPEKSRVEPLPASAGSEGAVVGGMRIRPTGAVASYAWYVNPDKTKGEVMLPPVTAADALRDDPKS